jgi:hypothetical protein
MVLVVTGLAAVAVPVLGTVGAGVATTATVNAVAAIEGASVGATIVAAGEGALVGAGAIGGGSGAGIALATLAGPVGWAVVGCSKNNDHNGDRGYTWDCWKPVVMDDSVGLSRGITLRDLYNHPNLKQMTVDGNDFVAENARGEQFRLSPVEVKGTLAFHAAPI